MTYFRFGDVFCYPLGPFALQGAELNCSDISCGNCQTFYCNFTTIKVLTISARNIHAHFFLTIGICIAKGIAKYLPNSEVCHQAPYSSQNSVHQGCHCSALLIGCEKFCSRVNLLKGDIFYFQQKISGHKLRNVQTSRYPILLHKLLYPFWGISQFMSDEILC